MSRTVLALVDGFTPVIDSLVAEMGLATAAVFGKVWRYCQMADGVCTASRSRMAEELGIAATTLDRHVDRLVAAGYLSEEAHPGYTNTLRDTGLAGLSVEIRAGGNQRERGGYSKTGGVGIAKPETPLCKTGDPLSQFGEGGIAKPETKKVLKKEFKETKEEIGAAIDNDGTATLEQVKGLLKNQLPSMTYKEMVQPMRSAGWNENQLRVQVPSERVLQWATVKGMYLFTATLRGASGNFEATLAFELPEAE
jgi:hypothetical protein